MIRAGAWGLVAIAFAAPLFTAGTYYLYLAELVAIYSVAALGLRQFLAGTNLLVFCQSAMMAIGGYALAITARELGGGADAIVAGVLIGLVLCAAAGAVLIWPAMRLRGAYFAMVTIALAWIVWRIAIEWIPVTGGDLGISAIPNLSRVSGLPPQVQYGVSLAVLAGVAFMLSRIGSSAFGLLQSAYASDATALAALGVRANLIRLVLFVLCSAIGGLAGALFAMHQAYINPNAFEVFDSVSLLIAVLIGGTRSPIGAIVGVAIIYIVPEFLHALDSFRLLFYGALVLVVLVVTRDGLVPDLRPEAWRRAAAPERSAATVLARNDRPVELKVSGVAKAFGSVRALDSVGFEVRSGQIHGVVGPNGSGKSTLLDVISALVPRDAGTVALNGRVLSREGVDRAARASVMRTFQKIRNFDALTCRENVLAGLLAHRFSRTPAGLAGAMFARVGAAEEARAASILESVGLAGHEHQQAGALAQGRRRLLELARILAADPGVLLLDEPTSGVSADEKESIARMIVQCRDAGMAIVIVDHDMELISRICDEVTALSAGRVIAQGAPGAVMENADFVSEYLGRSAGVA